MTLANMELKIKIINKNKIEIECLNKKFKIYRKGYKIGLNYKKGKNDIFDNTYGGMIVRSLFSNFAGGLLEALPDLDLSKDLWEKRTDDEIEEFDNIFTNDGFEEL